MAPSSCPRCARRRTPPTGSTPTWTRSWRRSKRLAELTGAEWGMVAPDARRPCRMRRPPASPEGIRTPRAHSEPRRLHEGRSDHPDALAERLRCSHPGGRRQDHRGRNSRSAAAGHRPEDRDDLLFAGPGTTQGRCPPKPSRQSRSRTTFRSSWMPPPRSSPFRTSTCSAERRLVGYSGGKFIRGPQSAGLLLGRKDLVKAAWVHSAPHHGYARAMKVGREEMIGMLVAVESWVTRDHAGEWKQWVARCDYIADRVSKIAGVTATVQREPGVSLSNRSPRVSCDGTRSSWGSPGQRPRTCSTRGSRESRLAAEAGAAVAAARAGRPRATPASRSHPR